VLFVAGIWYLATDQARFVQPKLFVDSIVYIQTAAQHASLQHLFYPKPIVVPAIYRGLGADPSAIAQFQFYFMLASWSAFGVVLLAAVRRLSVRVAIVIMTFAFVLTPYRIGFTASILSESINESLAMLIITIGFVLALAARWKPGRRRTIACWLLAMFTAVLALAWIMSRDTNAITALVATLVAALLWRLHRRVREAPWAVVLAALVVIGSVFAIWTATVRPRAPTQLTTHINFPPELTARATFPLINNIMIRVVPDHDARAYFADHGLPLADELAEHTDQWVEDDRGVLTDPHFEPARQWMVAHGTSTYARWLLRHPITRATEIGAEMREILVPQTLKGYMPKGWLYGWGWLRRPIRNITNNEVIVLLLALALPFVMRRPRAHIVTGVALVLIVSGLIGAIAAYYGDAFEISRHCYGAGQQIVLGLFLAPLGWFDRRSRARFDVPDAAAQ